MLNAVRRFLFLRIAALCFVAGGCMSSCICSDLGNTVDSIGKTVPKPLPTRMERGCPAMECMVELYRKDGQLYIDMPLVYVPDRRRGVDYVNPMGCPYGVLTLTRPYTEEELQAYPVSRIVITADHLTTGPLRGLNIREEQHVVRFRGARMWAETVNPHYIIMHEDSSRGGKVDFRVVPDFDRTEAEHLGRYNFADARQVAQQLPARRKLYNYALMPLSAIAYAADIPLSMLLMPLSFPFAETIDPNMDYTRVYHSERPEFFTDGE